MWQDGSAQLFAVALLMGGTGARDWSRSCDGGHCTSPQRPLLVGANAGLG